MTLSRTSTNRKGALNSSSRLTLAVKPANDQPGWEVFLSGSSKAFFFGRGKWDAERHAINYLAARRGGHLKVYRRDGLQVVTTVHPAPSRSDILRQAREICEAMSVPLVDPEIVDDFDVTAKNLEFTIALWRVCSENRFLLQAETSGGLIYQYGPFVLVRRRAGRFVLEQYETTADAVRRFDRFH